MRTSITVRVVRTARTRAMHARMKVSAPLESWTFPERLSLESTRVRQVLIIDEAQEMPAPVLNELRLLSSDKFDSRALLSVVFAGDARLSAKLGREDLLPLGSRIRMRLPFEPADTMTIVATLTHLMTEAGNANLMTPELTRMIAEHSMSNHRVAVSTASELLAAAESGERDTLDEALYLEVFGARGARRKKRGS